MLRLWSRASFINRGSAKEPGQQRGTKHLLGEARAHPRREWEQLPLGCWVGMVSTGTVAPIGGASLRKEQETPSLILLPLLFPEVPDYVSHTHNWGKL